jgi:hypothetical protein
MIWRFVTVSAMIGLVVPIVFETLYIFGGYIFRPGILFLWPSSILLMSTDGSERNASLYVVLAISIFLNILLYGGIGLLLFWGRKLIKK